MSGARFAYAREILPVRRRQGQEEGRGERSFVRSCAPIKRRARARSRSRFTLIVERTAPTTTTTTTTTVLLVPWIRIERVLIHTRVDPGTRERGARVTFHRALFPRSHWNDQQKAAPLKRYPRPLIPLLLPPLSLLVLSLSFALVPHYTVFSLPSPRFFCSSRSRTALINSIHRRRRFPLDRAGARARANVMLTPRL